MNSSTPGPGGVCTYIYRLEPGMGPVYDERHRAVWQEVVALIDQAGIYDYRIWRHEEIVVCSMRTRSDFEAAAAITAASEIQRRWTASLADAFAVIGDEAGRPLWLTEVFAHRVSESP